MNHKSVSFDSELFFFIIYNTVRVQTELSRLQKYQCVENTCEWNVSNRMLEYFYTPARGWIRM
jgi:hypothetical protein